MIWMTKEEIEKRQKELMEIKWPVKEEHKIEILLKEYEKAQDSAQHHDLIFWQTASILIGGMLILLGGIVSDRFFPKKSFIIFFISLFGIAMCLYLLKSYRIKRDQCQRKYGRCHEIEGLLGIKQHIGEKEKPTLSDYLLVIVSFLLFIWFIILASTLIQI
jgi:nitrate/nitrite transporter NarK